MYQPSNLKLFVVRSDTGARGGARLPGRQPALLPDIRVQRAVRAALHGGHRHRRRQLGARHVHSVVKARPSKFLHVDGQKCGQPSQLMPDVLCLHLDTTPHRWMANLPACNRLSAACNPKWKCEARSMQVELPAGRYQYSEALSAPHVRQSHCQVSGNRRATIISSSLCRLH